LKIYTEEIQVKKLTVFIIVLSMLICTVSTGVSAAYALGNGVYWRLEELDSRALICTKTLTAEKHIFPPLFRR